MSSTERILEALREHGYEPKRSGNGWMCRCPGHPDRSQSFSIGTGEDGRALVNCFAGCETADVLAAIALEMRDLMPDTATKTGRRKRRNGVSGTGTVGKPPKNTTSYATAREAVAALERWHGKRSALWTYHGASGEPVGLIVRWDRPQGKDIRPVSRLGSRWFIGAMPAPRPLYRLPELADAPRVYITEGEKAADAARSVGLIATTSAHGSKSASKTDWTPLAGKECVLLPDNDDAGRRYADEVAAILAR